MKLNSNPTIEELQEVIRQRPNPSYWPWRRCGICDEWVYYEFIDYKPYFNGKCGCTKYAFQPEARLWNSVLDAYAHNPEWWRIGLKAELSTLTVHAIEAEIKDVYPRYDNQGRDYDDSIVLQNTLSTMQLGFNPFEEGDEREIRLQFYAGSRVGDNANLYWAVCAKSIP